MLTTETGFKLVTCRWRCHIFAETCRSSVYIRV